MGLHKVLHAFREVKLRYKEKVMSEYKEVLYGLPPSTDKNGKMLPKTGTPPDLERLHKLLSL